MLANTVADSMNLEVGSPEYNQAVRNGIIKPAKSGVLERMSAEAAKRSEERMARLDKSLEAELATYRPVNAISTDDIIVSPLMVDGDFLTQEQMDANRRAAAAESDATIRKYLKTRIERNERQIDASIGKQLDSLPPPPGLLESPWTGNYGSFVELSREHAEIEAARASAAAKLALATGPQLIAGSGQLPGTSAIERMDAEARAPGANRIENQVGPVVQGALLAATPVGQMILAAQSGYQMGTGGAQISHGEVASGTLNILGGALTAVGSVGSYGKEANAALRYLADGVDDFNGIKIGDFRFGAPIRMYAVEPSVGFVNNVEGANNAASFVKATSNDYRTTFFAAYPELEGKVVVHHAVEQQVLIRYPGVVSLGEMNSLENLRGIPNELNSSFHLSDIRKSWNSFYRANPNPTAQDLLNHATKIDNTYGAQFKPPVR